ncbi:protein kinase [Thermoactinomyces sp. DSM 45892]|uniref:protein kinase domain-containing protein n=1 Tax=Thermoactinomyces sp. DSM 45892 TaxID=1882753 RepID=UPI0008979025|nr:protein kinase [Thermoactinomyces sp. DSM 45892]SDY50452.1 Serine/threonine protein kinase [Thermoactinomyces sp. DSM 45892]
MEIGHKLDNRYELVEQIGGGGMATVYKAIDLVLERFVAVKILNHSLLDDQAFVNRFVFEARATAKLSHPHVVKVFDAGVDSQNYYIVMELVEGQTLKQYISQYGPLAEIEAVHIMRQICLGLAHAHNQGIIHRDIKPQNIIYSTEDATYKVADFGISRVLQETNSFTQTGKVVGSVHYMSPEQITEQPVGFATDLYSLGVVFFELLAGRPPYRAKEMVMVALQHINDPVPDLKKYNAVTSDKSIQVITKLLDKNPENRYQSIGDLLDELDDLLPNGHQKQQTKDLRSPKKQKKYDRKRFTFLPILLGIIMIVIIGIIGYSSFSNQASTTQKTEQPTTSHPVNTESQKIPRWKKEEPTYFTNDVFLKHSITGSNGNYTVKLKVSQKLARPAIYYNVYVVGKTTSEIIITRKKVPIQLKPNKKDTDITFSVTISKSHIPPEGIFKIEIFWLDDENDYRRDRIENLLEKF